MLRAAALGLRGDPNQPITVAAAGDILGACPGPIFALIGSGITVMVVALGAAVLGTWAYALLRDYLPH